MQITDVRVRKITKEGKMKAVVSITLDDEFVVHDIKVIEGEKGLFIAMPEQEGNGRRISGISHIPSILPPERICRKGDPGELREKHWRSRKRQSKLHQG